MLQAFLHFLRNLDQTLTDQELLPAPANMLKQVWTNFGNEITLELSIFRQRDQTSETYLPYFQQ